MNSSLGLLDSTDLVSNQKFYYYSGVVLSNELLRDLSFSGFSEATQNIDFQIKSSEPLVVEVEDKLFQVTDLNELKDLVEFFRELKRYLLLNSSMSHSEEFSDQVATLIEKIYSENDENFIDELFKLNELKSSFRIDKILKSESHTYRNLEDYCFDDANHFYLLYKKSENIDVEIESIAQFISIMRANSNVTIESETSVSDFINSLDFPVVIYNESNIVHYHNESFSRLNVTATFINSIVKSDWLDLDDSKYKVLASKFGSLTTVCLIEQEFDYSQSHSELGIITGSIAHELNNPLAGILAAISMLELEDWNDEDSGILKDMKSSANRCRQLINTFLGFSRVRGDREKRLTFSELLQQSISLLNNRKIESGISIETSIGPCLSQIDGGGVTLPIILYLIISDMMTIKNHEMLINKDQNFLKYFFERNESDLIINVSGIDLENNKRSIQSRLIIHLLGLENSKLLIEKQEITITNIIK